MLRLWKRSACQQIWRSESGNVAPVSGCGVQNLETLRFLASLMLRGWKRYAFQRIWCSMSRNIVPVSGFGVQNLKTLVPVSGCGVQNLGNAAFLRLGSGLGLVRRAGNAVHVWKHFACRRIWCSESGKIASDLVLSIWKHLGYTSQPKFGVQNLKTLCMSAVLVYCMANGAGAHFGGLQT